MKKKKQVAYLDLHVTPALELCFINQRYAPCFCFHFYVYCLSCFYELYAILFEPLVLPLYEFTHLSFMWWSTVEGKPS